MRPMAIKFDRELPSDENPINTPRVFHVETTWKQPFSRRFNVEYTWCVCREDIIYKATQLDHVDT